MSITLKMALKCYSLVFLAITLGCNCAVSESRRLGPLNGNPWTGVENSNSILSRPGIQQTILNYILQSQGSSLEQLQETIQSADGDVEAIVSGINSELNSDLLTIDGDLIRINPEILVGIIRDAVGLAIRDKLSNKPFLVPVVESGINKQIDSLSGRLAELIENNPIRAQQLLENHNLNKRSLQPRDATLGSIITDIVLNVLQSQLKGVVGTLIDSAINFLQQFYSDTIPETANDLQRIIAYAKNTLIETVVGLLTNLKNSINVTPTAPASSNTEAAARRKRQLFK